VQLRKPRYISLSAGIFVNQIIDAVPIDKYFELFKPNAGGEGGFIRICLDFAKEPEELDRAGNVSDSGFRFVVRGICQLLWLPITSSLHPTTPPVPPLNSANVMHPRPCQLWRSSECC
jgi:hypothetical protein